MGTCLGRCLRRCDSGGTRGRPGHGNMLIQDDSVEFYTLMETEQTVPEPIRTKGTTSFVSRIFANLDKKKKITKKKPVLELADETWSPLGEATYSRLNESESKKRLQKISSGGDISLQCLDARALLARSAAKDRSVTVSTSTPPSSLDLEWEHEGLPSPAPWQIVPEEEDLMQLESFSQTSHAVAPTQPRCSSEVTNISGWSRISTPDSLEWDPVQAPLHTVCDLPVSDLDAETEQLLSEIERLTKRALRETGRELRR